MKLNRTIKKITSLFFVALMITSVFAAFVTPVVASITPPTPGNITIKGLRISETVICTTELAALPVVTRNVTLVGRDGIRTNMTATGPLFNTVLREKFGINQTDLTNVTFTASDDFSQNFQQGILQNRDIILAYLINNTAFTEGDEYWPIRIIVPDEMGLYWVRMLTTIEIINGTHVPVKLPAENFIADGGSSLVPVAERLGEIFTERTGVEVFVNQTTTGRGIRAAGEGRANIGMGGRDLRDTELAEFPDLKSVQIAKEGVAFIVHPGNSVDSLTIDEIRKIFSGEIKNWNQTGGKDAEITIVTRQPGAGLRDMMVDIIMRDVKICETAITKYSTWDAKDFVSKNEFAIGFVGTAAVDETVRSIKVNGITPTDENIRLGAYPIARFMYFYTLGKPDTLEQQFINLTLSDEGQAILEEYGFISIINVAHEPVVPPTPAPRIPGFGIIATILGILGAILILFKEKN